MNQWGSRTAHGIVSLEQEKKSFPFVRKKKPPDIVGCKRLAGFDMQ